MFAYQTQTAMPRRCRARLLAGCAVATAAIGSPAVGQSAFQATPTAAVGPGYSISQTATLDTVTITAPQAVINWTPTDNATNAGAPINILAAGNELRFTANPNNVSDYTVLNRVVPADPSRPIQFDGNVTSRIEDPGYGVTAGGNIWFYSPGGIILGGTAQFDVGSLVLTANDILLNGDGGLFANPGTTDQSGTIRFAGVPDSKSFVTVNAGAQINTLGNESNGTNGYVAVAAPRVKQGGTINTKGSTALIAAESVDLTIPISGGLFDIVVNQGSKVDTAGETTLDHSGATEINDPDADVGQARIYMVAVPKNDAVTMLVAGSVGYDAASGAQAANGAIYLTTGNFTFGESVFDASGGKVQVTGGNYTSRTEIVAQDVVVNTSTAALGFGGNLDIRAGSGILDITAQDGRDIAITGDLNARHVASKTDGSSAIGVTANAGSTISANNIGLRSDAFGANESGYGAVAAIAAKGGLISVVADGGIITAGTLEFKARGSGGTGSDADGAKGTGGTVNVTATNNGQVLASNSLFLIATGTGGDSSQAAGGEGIGGSAKITVDAGAKVVVGGAVLQAAASGGDTGDADGGSATGGIATVSVNGGLFQTSNNTLFEVSAGGGDSNKAAGSATGGIASLLIGDTGSEVKIGQGLAMQANAFGGGSGFPITGGKAQGGTAVIDAGSGTLTIALGEGVATRLEAKAASGFGFDRSGDSIGGTIKVDLKGTTASLQNLFGNASATVSNQTLADVSDPFADNGGDAAGGSVAFTFTGATVDTLDIGIDVNGQGGFGGASDMDGVPIKGTKAGSGAGGKAALNVSGGELTTGSIVLDARAFGGNSHSSEDVEFGGAGLGGDIALGLSGVKLSSLSNISLFASGTGGGGDASAGGTGTGGKIALSVGSGTTLAVVGVLQAIAKGDAADGFSFGGAAQGGMIDIAANGGTIDSFQSIDASANAGAAFGGGAAFDQIGKIAGAALGGSIKIGSKAGGLIAGSGNFLVNAEGGRGFADIAGGDAKGGTIALTTTGGTFDLTNGTPSFNAIGTAGDANDASVPTIGRGGTIDIQLNAGSGSDPASEFLFGDLLLDATGRIFDSSDGNPEPANAGTGIGGTVSVAVNSGTLSGSLLELYADGIGGNGEEGGVGGAGHQGKASFTVTGGNANLTTALRVYAGAFGAAGINEDQEGNEDAGTGGAAGMGINPYGAGAGATVALTGGTLTTPILLIDGASEAGDGGRGDQFTDAPLAGNGGDAAGGIASFTTSGTAGATIGDLKVTAAAFAGNGGEVEYGYGFEGSADGVAGSGGIATGGLAVISITGTGINSFSRIEAHGDGNGGSGGSVTSLEGFSLSGTGQGGLSGFGSGGTASVTIGADLASGAQLIANANGFGANGGAGPTGAAGGAASGGSALIDIIGGSNSFNETTASAIGFAGNGSDGDSGNAGDGGAAQGGSATIRVSGTGTVASTAIVFVSGSAAAGDGGDGGSDFSTGGVGGNGGNGGVATGGGARFDLLDGTFSLTDVQTTALFLATATGGSGGNGGSGDADPQGSGGAGGNGFGGSVVLFATGGQATFPAINLVADGEGGPSGIDGGISVLAGSAGDGSGGNVLLSASGGADLTLQLGSAILSADGVSGLGTSNSGRVEIKSTALNPDGAINFASLDAHSRSTGYDPDSVSGIFVSAAGGPIVVSGSAAFDARGPLSFGFNGAGSLVSKGGSIAASSFESISVSHKNAAGAPSITAAGITLTADGSIVTGPGSLLKSTLGNIDLQAFTGSATLNAAEAAGNVRVRADGDVSVGSVDAVNLDLYAGRADFSGSITSGRDTNIFGPITVSDSADIAASRDVIIGDGAQVTAGRLISITSGDDIIIGSNALVRAANNAPDETGYGATDPLQQQSQLKLFAGGLDVDPVDGNVASILISGTLEAPERTVQLRAGAIQANGSTVVEGGNLYARIDNAPVGDQVPSNDFGQLSGACLEGSICLDVANINGIVRVGDSGSEPVNLRLLGGIDGTDVLLRASGEVRLGEAGVARSVRGSDNLEIVAGNGNLTLLGPIEIFGGGTTRVSALGNIVGAEATIEALGALDLYAANNITLDAIAADTIRNVAPDGTILNPAGINLPGTLKVGQIAIASGPLDLQIISGITLGTVSAPGLITLNSADAITVATDAAAPSGLIATGRSVSLVGINGLNIKQASASSGNVTLKTSGGALNFESVIASGAVSVDAVGDANGGDISAGSIAFQAGGAAIANQLTAKSGTLVASATKGLDVTNLVSSGAVSLAAPGGLLRVSNVISAPSGITASAASINLRGVSDLKITSATATAGNALLATQSGPLFVDNASATGLLSLAAVGDVTVSGSASGGSLKASTSGALSGNKLAATAGDLSASATAITLDQLAATGAGKLTATNGDVTVSSNAAATGGITASGKSIALTGAGGLTVTQATASAGDITLVSGGGTLAAGTGLATGKITVTAAGPLTFTSLDAAGALTITSAGDATGGEARGSAISVASNGALSASKLTSNSGAVDVSAKNGIALDRVASAGAATLTALNGAAKVTTDAISAAGVVASGQSVSLAGLNGLKVAQAIATAGDVTLTAFGGPLDVKSAQASGAVALTGAATVDFASLIAGGLLTIDAGGDIIGGSAQASAIDVSGSSAINADSLSAGSGGVLVNTQGPLSIGFVSTPGLAQLQSGKGLVQVITDLSAGSAFLSGTEVAATGQNGLSNIQAFASSGDILLDTVAGQLDVDTAQAAGTISLLGGDGVSFTTLKAGGAIGVKAEGAITAGWASGSNILFITPGQVTVSGKIDAVGPIDIEAGSIITVKNGGMLATGQGLTLQSSTGAILSDGVLSAADTVTLTGTAVQLIGADGKNVVVSATAGDAKIAGPVSAAATLKVQATGNILASTASLTAGDAILTAAGKVEGGSLTAASATLNGAAGVAFKTVQATGAAVLIADAGAITISDDIVGGSIAAAGKSVALTGKNGLNVAQAKASGGNIALTALAGTLSAGTLEASADIGLVGAGPVTFTSLKAGGAIGIDAQGDVTGGSAIGATVAITTPGILKANNLVALNGALSALATKGITLDTAISSGTTTLKADQGTVTVLSDVKPDAGLIVAAPSINLTGQNGLNIAEANATAGDLILNTTAGALIAGKSTAAGAITLSGASTIDFASLTAQQGVTIKAGGNITGGAINGTTIAVSTPGTLNAGGLAASIGGVDLSAANGISLASIAAGGPVTLGASAGAIKVATDLATSGPIQATAQSISLNALGSLNLTKAIAAADLSVVSGGTITVGSAVGATIALSSKDIVIGASSQLGSASQTTALTLTSTADRTFIGASDNSTGYRLDNNELARIATKGDVKIVSAPTGQTSTAFNLTDPDGSNVVIGSMTFDGAQLGSGSSFTIVSPSSIGVVGNLQFKNFQAGQTVTLQSLGDVSLATETGLVTVKDSQGGLAGTLRLQAQQVHAMSTKARSEVENLTLNEAKQRLGTNDQIENDGGYFQAGNIVVRIGRLVFIQNSGANGEDPNLSRGFTTNNLTLEAIGEEPAQAIINGRVGAAVGGDLITKTTLIGDFDPNSGFNGCSAGGGTCGVPDISTPVFAAVRDQIESEEEEDEKEEALQASQTRPDPVIQIVGAPTSRFDPLIDEPITGAGNEDLWEQPGRTP